MGLDHLWAAWRNAYVVKATADEREGVGGGCVFCALSDLEPAASNGVLATSTSTFAVPPVTFIAASVSAAGPTCPVSASACAATLQGHRERTARPSC